MSNVYIFTCKVCGKSYKRYSYMVYEGVEDVCTKCNNEIPWDGAEASEEDCPICKKPISVCDEEARKRREKQRCRS